MTAFVNSPLGILRLETDGTALTGLALWETSVITDILEHPVFVQTKMWLDAYFAHQPLPLMPLLRLHGTPFQMQVWRELQKIPYGTSRSYGDITREIARQKGIKRMSAQAVGTAVGHNPIAILVPCHRVLAKDGRIGGYAGGLDRKRALLQTENIHYLENGCISV